jgi:hypothetical protein
MGSDDIANVALLLPGEAHSILKTITLPLIDIRDAAEISRGRCAR